MIHALLTHLDVMADKNSILLPPTVSSRRARPEDAMFYNSTLAANMRIPDTSGVVVNINMLVKITLSYPYMQQPCDWENLQRTGQ